MEWSCSTCTLRNAHDVQECGACGSKNDNINDAVLDIAAIHSLTEWECPKCTVINENDRQRCLTCGAEQPQDAFADMLLLQFHLGNGNSPMYHDGLLSEAAGFTYSDVTTLDGGQVVPVASSVTTDVITQYAEVSDTGMQASASESASSYTSEDEIRIVLMGRTGDGKSATGNTILGTLVFESTPSPSSVTKACQRGTCTRFGRTIQVIDTPGMFDTEMSTADITREVVRCVAMTAPGPHVFLLVLTPGRHTEEVQNTIAHYMEIFGEEMVNYLIVVFTRKDDLTNSDTTIEDYIGKDSGKLKVLLNSCNYRYVAFNNRGTPQEKEEDVKRLLNLSDEMVNGNRGVYTNDMYKEAERIMNAKEDDIRRKHEENLGRQKEESNRRLRAVEENYTDTVAQLLNRLQDLEQHDVTNGSRQESDDIQGLLHAMEVMHNNDMREMRAEMLEIQSRRPNNCREVARREVDDGSDFLLKTLLPGMFVIAKELLPVILKLAL